MAKSQPITLEFRPMLPAELAQAASANHADAPPSAVYAALKLNAVGWNHPTVAFAQAEIEHQVPIVRARAMLETMLATTPTPGKTAAKTNEQPTGSKSDV